MEEEKIAELKQFVEACKSNPSILNDPSLSFFKNYLKSLGARIPKSSKSRMSDENDDAMEEDEDDCTEANKPNQFTEDDNIEDEIAESDIELDGDVVEPDNDPPQKMGDPSVEVTEESRDAAQMSKAKAMDAISEDKLDEAIEHITEAILLNPSSAILYATRASVFVKMNKPNAAIRDADAALQMNPDSAKGYKSRGMARAMLGQWEAAAKDLHVASKLDYDDEIKLALKKVEPNANKIEEHRRKYERLRKELELRKVERVRQRRPAKAQYEKEKGHSSENRASGPSRPNPESMVDLQEGNVVGIHSARELETKFSVASSLSRLVILYFTASWCGPCRFISPVYTSLGTKYPKVVFLKADIDEVKDVAMNWNINSVPTFIFIKNGKEVDRLAGADKNGLEKKIALYAGQS